MERAEYMDLNTMTACELTALVRSGAIRCADVVEASLVRIARQEPAVNAFITVLADQARVQAAALDRRIGQGGPVGALAGVPVAIKDNICMAAVRTTCGSRILENFISPYDAAVVEQVRRADGIIIGKTNMDEFAMGSSTETSAFGPTRNPLDPARVPGGSSGGSAAAVAAGEAFLALGSDTGGSIRQPAAFCGVVGLKPTYGRVSRYGLVAYASSLDQIGPFSRTVADAALLLGVLAAHDERDSTSARMSVPNYSDLGDPAQVLRTVTFGVPREYGSGDLHPAVAARLTELIAALKERGARQVDISLPHTRYAIPTYYLIASAEASANLARYDGVKYGLRAEGAADLESLYTATRTQGFGPEVKRRIMLGTYALSSGYYDAYYLKALRVRTLIKQDFERAFETCDFILTPTAPSPAFAHGEKINDPIQMYLSDIFTISGNLAGVPGLSLPCGNDPQGLPIGMQLYARPFAEHELLCCGQAIEQDITSDWQA
jgi:aspartyl-tRNA(Asn)/glutamyl-tRNA(Gln) amidotransferase subunit A